MTEFVGFAGMDEAQLRMFVAQLFTQGGFTLARSGVIGNKGLGVAQTSTASASVTVDAGACIAQSSVLDGAIPMVNPTTETLDILNANPLGGVPRNDIVVFDSATETIRNIVGTPNAVPTDPTVPSSAVALARLRLDPGVSATTVPNSQIDSLRRWVSVNGGVVQVIDQADRDSLYAVSGLVAYRSDIDAVQVYDGAGWDTLGNVSDAKAGKRTHWGTASITTDASGIATVTHGAGFTPSVVDPSRKGITGSLWRVDQSDNYTSTTFDVRVVDGTGGTAPNGTALTIQFFCGE
jgi:hypothetical protein